MARQHTEAFIEALHRLEEERDPEPIVSLFAPDAELRNPLEEHVHQGREGARRFWETYRRTFREIRSEFRHVVECDEVVALEWTSRGRTAEGHDFAYDGVSVVEFRDGAVRGFRAYFDPGRITEQIGRRR